MDIQRLSTHMMKSEFFKDIIHNTNTVYHNKKSSVKQTLQTQKDYYDISDDDKLFWAFYIIQNSYEDYSFLKRTFSKEKQLKFEMIETLHPEKQKLKSHKIRISTLIEDLGASHIITLPTFIGLCCAYNKNICVYRNKIMASYQFDNTTNEYYILNGNTNELHTKCYNSAILENKYVIVANLDKPLKGVTSYKKGELKEIASKFGVQVCNSSTKKEKTKQQLYQEILEYI